MANHQIKKSWGVRETNFRNPSNNLKTQFLTKPPVDVVVFARDAEKPRINQEVQYKTVPSQFTSHETFRPQEFSSCGRHEDLSRSVQPQFLRASNEIVNDTNRRDSYVHHNSPMKASETNLDPRQGQYRSNCDNRTVNSVSRTYFKPIHPIRGNLSSIEIDRDYTSELDEDVKYSEHSRVQYNSDPYLPKLPVRPSYKNFDTLSPRSTNYDIIPTMKRVRLAIPHNSESNGNADVPASPKKSAYDESDDGSMIQVTINEGGDINIRNRCAEGGFGNNELSPRRRPTGFGDRLLPQVPENSGIDHDLKDANLLQKPAQNGLKYDNYKDSPENESPVDKFEHKNSRRVSSHGNSMGSNPNYLKRRRTAVFGLSPTSGLNIGAVM
jgi:hypothetical protein